LGPTLGEFENFSKSSKSETKISDGIS
jgi:hypothetical protein